MVVPKTITAKQLNLLIKQAPEHGRMIFQPGDYIFREPLIVDRNDISLVGTGRYLTRLRFDFDEGGDFIQIKGGAKSAGQDIAESAGKGAKSFMLKNTSALSAGDAVYISRPNTVDYLLRNDWSNVPVDVALTRPFREAIASIKGVAGRTVTLEEELPFSFPKSKTRIRKIKLLSGVMISDMTIVGSLGSPNPTLFRNSYREFKSRAAIRSFRTRGLKIHNTEFINVPSKAIAIDSSIDANIDNILINGSHNKGPGGEGYGIELREAFNCKLTRLTILNTRHAVLFSSWHAEVGNEVQIDFTNRDINFHGSVDHSNTVAVSRIELEYDLSQRDGRPINAWSTISQGGRRHAKTDFLATNNISLKYVKGSWRNDVLHAAKTGSVLQTGPGNDIVYGGPGIDIVTGGPGSDHFHLGEGDDQVIDFETGKGGDVLILPDNVRSEDIRFEEEEHGLLLIVGKRGTIRLNGVSRSQFQLKNLRFCSTDCATNEASSNI